MVIRLKICLSVFHKPEVSHAQLAGPLVSRYGEPLAWTQFPSSRLVTAKGIAKHFSAERNVKIKTRKRVTTSLSLPASLFSLTRSFLASWAAFSARQASRSPLSAGSRESMFEPQTAWFQRARKCQVDNFTAARDIKQ